MSFNYFDVHFIHLLILDIFYKTNQTVSIVWN